MTTTHRALTQIPRGELAALITIETVERLVLKASLALQHDDPDRVRALLSAILVATTQRLALTVADEAVTDHIADRARFYVSAAEVLINSDLQLARERTAPGEDTDLLPGTELLHALITDALLDGNIHPQAPEQRDRLLRAKELAWHLDQAAQR